MLDAGLRQVCGLSLSLSGPEIGPNSEHPDHTIFSETLMLTEFQISCQTEVPLDYDLKSED